MTVSVSPDLIREGLPIHVRVELNDLASALVQSKTETLNLEIPLEQLTDKTKGAEFTIDQSGDYILSVGAESVDFKVHPQKFMDFGFEFGLKLLVVPVLLGGLIWWTIHHRKKTYA